MKDFKFKELVIIHLSKGRAPQGPCLILSDRKIRPYRIQHKIIPNDYVLELLLDLLGYCSIG